MSSEDKLNPSVIPEVHKSIQHTSNERCSASYKVCDDTTCILYGKHNVCTEHEFHPGDRIINWELRNKTGWVYYTKPTVVSVDQVVYIKYDNDNNRIHASFGKCACGDIFLKNDVDRDLSKSLITSKYSIMFPQV